MNALQSFCYNGSNVSMTRNENGVVYVNLTEFAKPFPNKNLTQIINSQEIKDYCHALSKLQNYSLADLLLVKRGGNDNGTWGHQKVALRVAQKLSPNFAVWVDTKIEEILTQGVATVRNDDEAIAYAMEVLNKRLSESKQRVQILEGENSHLQEQNRILAPKAVYTDEVLQSTSTYTFTQCAKELNFRSATAFLSELKRRGIIFKQSGQYQLTSKFAGNGYTTSRTTRYYHADGRPDTSTSTVVTEKGRMWLHKLFCRTNA